MSTREKPYRSKAPVSFFDLVQTALSSTFFLVHESGPTSFVLKDEQGKSIKVSLGCLHSCTCGGGKAEHCLHTLYVLLKIFRVLPDNPIIWQLSFIDSEINWLIRNRNCPILENKPKRERSSSARVERIELHEEFGCPICQDELKDLESVTYCKVGCGHNFHIKCMKIWAEHKVSQKDPITCPLCRCDWGPNVLSELTRLLRKNRKKPQIHSNSACVGCRVAPITGVKYHCLVCPEFDMCGKCYKMTHKEHPFIQKAGPTCAWEPAIRISQNMEENREFSPNDYEMLQQLDAKPCFSEYIFSVLPESRGDVCYICKKPQRLRWKILACGHTVHDECVLQMIREENYTCGIDGVPFLLGLGEPEKKKEIPENGLSVMGLHVGNPVIAFRQRRKVVAKKKENHSASSSRTAVIDLPPLIVTRLSKK